MEKKKKKILIYLTTFTFFSSTITYKLVKKKEEGLIRKVNEYIEDFQDDDFLICAHRGYQKDCIENTKEAIEKANNSSFIDYIEVDVRLTKDNQLVLSHNDYLVDEKERSIHISSTNYDDLIEDTFMNQTNPIINNSLSEEEKLFILRNKLNLISKSYQLSSLIEGINLSNNKLLILDLKFQNNSDEFIQELIKELENVDTSNLIFQSTDAKSLLELQQLLPGNYCLIIDSKNDLNYINDFTYFSFKKSLINYQLIEYLLSKGKKIAIWTINNSKDLDTITNQSKDYYKDLIYITDYPDLIATKLYQKSVTFNLN